MNWTAMPSVFPSGMVAIQEKIRLPTVMHNRQWSDHSDYIHNWTDIPWYTDHYAIPHDPQVFFKRFFTQQEGWGLTMYEQDWMCTEYDGVTHLQTILPLGDAWLKGMADGAQGTNRTVQYCMPFPNQVLAAAAFPAVTNARATGDYFHAHDQWAVGATSLFYWAIGVLPFKDGFYSSTNKQIGGQTVGPERNPDREALMATLSCAMVGPMDGINLLNKSRVMTTCRADGTVLKPDEPVHTSDACFAASGGSGCYDYRAVSAHAGYGDVTYVYSDAGHPITPAMAHVDAAASAVVYNWYTGAVTRLSATGVQMDKGYEGHVYTIVAPVVSGWAFVGEVDKYVTAAKIRFSSITASVSSLSATVTGVAGETVRTCAIHAASSLELQCQSVTFTAAGSKSVTWK